MARSGGPTGVLSGHKRPFPHTSSATLLKNSSFARAPECAVCLQGLDEPTNAIFQAPGCAHRFHLTYIVDWVSHSAAKQQGDLGTLVQCPICRRGWDPNEVPVASPKKLLCPDNERMYPVEMDDDIDSLGLVQRTNAFSQLDRRQMAQTLQQSKLGEDRVGAPQGLNLSATGLSGLQRVFSNAPGMLQRPFTSTGNEFEIHRPCYE